MHRASSHRGVTMSTIDQRPEVENIPSSPLVLYSKRRTFLLSALFAPGAGLVASLLAVVLMGLLRLVVGIPTPMELFGDYVLKHINVNTFIRLLITFGPNAKTLPLGFALYGTALCLAYRALLPKQPVATVPAAAQSRRLLLSRAGVAALTVGGIAGTLGEIRGFLSNYASYDGMKSVIHTGGITPPITPNNEHYVVTQNTVDPTPTIDLWRLEVTGLVGSSGTY